MVAGYEDCRAGSDVQRAPFYTFLSILFSICWQWDVQIRVGCCVFSFLQNASIKHSVRGCYMMLHEGVVKMGNGPLLSTNLAVP